MRKLQSNPTLIGYAHIVLDEVHERDKHSAFLMICLRDILCPQATDLKVVLIKATLQTHENNMKQDRQHRNLAEEILKEMSNITRELQNQLKEKDDLQSSMELIFRSGLEQEQERRV